MTSPSILPALSSDTTRFSQNFPVLDWIDRELGETRDRNRCDRADALLELRQLFRDTNLNKLVGNFFRLLPQLETNHYLLGFRIRTWLSSQYEILVSDPLERTPPMVFPLTHDQRPLSHLKRIFFEQAEVAIPMNDIRMQVVKARTQEGLLSGK